MAVLPLEFRQAWRNRRGDDFAVIMRLLEVQRPDLADYDPRTRLDRLKEAYATATFPLARSIGEIAPGLTIRPMKTTPELVVSGRARDWERLLPMLPELVAAHHLDLIPDRTIVLDKLA